MNHLSFSKDCLVQPFTLIESPSGNRMRALKVVRGDKALAVSWGKLGWTLHTEIETYFYKYGSVEKVTKAIRRELRKTNKKRSSKNE